MDKFLMTQSLLGAWKYVYKLDDGYEKFLQTLSREKTPPTKAMLDGQRFENVVNATLNGAELDEKNEFYAPIQELYPILVGSQQQVKVYKDITICDNHFLLYGILDFLKAGIIYDTKFSKTYDHGKYFDSPQHPMYFELVPEAREFTYLICNGKDVFKETYHPCDLEQPIQLTIRDFMDFLKRNGLLNEYKERWQSK